MNSRKKNKYYFNKAKEASKLSDFNKVHIGCVMVYKNIILSHGYNTYQTHPFQMKYDIYRKLDWNKNVEPKHCLHAEMMALIKIMNLDIDFSKVLCYIYREDMNGRLAECRPCNACEKALRDLGIKQIYYTTTNNYRHEIFDI